jgi:hypothetical protein
MLRDGVPYRAPSAQSKYKRDCEAQEQARAAFDRAKAAASSLARARTTLLTPARSAPPRR